MQTKMTKQAQPAEMSVFSIAKAKHFAGKAKEKTLEAVKNRKVQVTVASAAGGTVAVGFCGAALGGVVGIPFALFTFGLSIPVTATVGAVVGGTAGCATGGTVGFAAFTKRKEIEKLYSVVGAKLKTMKVQFMGQASETYRNTTIRLRAGKDAFVQKARAGGLCLKQKASDLTSSGVQLAKEPQVQVTAASAAAGGAALGAGGGAVGLATGGLAGAAVGVLPALFTFGLSIPIGAAVGGGAGLCVGSVIGGTTGVVGGGAVGYGVYGKKTEIYAGFNKCVAYAKEKKDQVLGQKKPVDNTPKTAEPPKKIRPEATRA